MTDWRKVEIETYIDIESIRLIGENIFECWVKTTKGSYAFDNIQKKYNQKLGYQLCKYLIDCTNGEFAIKGIILYSNDGQIIEQGNLNIMEVEWTQIPPDSLANNIFGIVTGKFSRLDLEKENSTMMSAKWAFWLSVIIGLIITTILGTFAWRIKVDPFFSLVTIAYTIHPLCRYKFNYKKMKLNHNLLRRFIVMGLIMHCLFMICFYNNMTDYNHRIEKLSTYLKEANDYCMSNTESSANSPFTCILGYIKDKKDQEVSNVINRAETECNNKFTMYEYQVCIYEKLSNVNWVNQTNNKQQQRQ